MVLFYLFLFIVLLLYLFQAECQSVIHYFAEVRFGRFHALAIVSDTAMATGVQISFQDVYFVSSGYIPRIRTAIYMSALFLIFAEPPNCFPLWLHQFPFLPTVHRGSPFSNIIANTSLICFLIITILTGVRRQLIVVIICISFMISNTEHFFVPVSCCISLK